MANINRPFGVACIRTGDRQRLFRRFKNLAEAEQFVDERRAAGDTVLHIERKTDQQWHVVVRFTGDGHAEPVDESQPRRISHLTERERATRFFPRWRLAALERQNHLCECGARATVVGYPRDTRRAPDQPLDIDALIAVCPTCAGEPAPGIVA